MRAPLAVTPDQFAGVVDGDDDDDQAEGAAQRLDHHPRHGKDRRAVKLTGEQQGHDAEGEAQGQQNEIGRALEHGLHLEAGARDQLRPSRLEAVGRRGQRRDGRGRLGRGVGQGAQLLLLAQLGPARRRTIQGEGGGQEGQADPQPQKLVAQQDAGQGRIDRIPLSRRPVFGRQAIGAGAERLQPGHQGLKLRLGAEDRGGGEIEDHDRDHADIGGHHRARHRRQGEEDRRAEQQPRQAQDDEAVKIVQRPEGTDRLLVHPRHQRADQNAQRDAQEGQGHHGEGAEEAAIEVVELRQPAGLDHGTEARRGVAHHDIGDDGRRRQHEEDVEDQMRVGDRIGGVLEDITARPDADVRAGDRAEAQQEEEDGNDPEGGLAKLIAELEGRDFPEHDPGLRRLERRPGGARRPGSRNRRPPDRPRPARSPRPAWRRPGRGSRSDRRTGASR
ncbi:hypothetical protein D3C80_657760 [compost metagenome]